MLLSGYCPILIVVIVKEKLVMSCLLSIYIIFTYSDLIESFLNTMHKTGKKSVLIIIHTVLI